MIAASRTAPVSATITANDAAAMAWEAVVVGAGPAGAATACRLAARGVRTLLVDRHEFPRGKACGCCLSPRAIRELRDLSPDALPGDAIRLDAVRLAHRQRSVEIPLPAGRVVSRDVLDTHLVRCAIAAGCHWLPAVHVSSVIDARCGTATIVQCSLGSAATDRGSHAIQSTFAVLAGGLADHVRTGIGTLRGGPSARHVAATSRIGLGTVLPADACDLPEGTLLMAVGRHGYCGLVRLEDGRIDVAAALDRAALGHDAHAARAVAAIIAEAADHAACRLRDADALRAARFRATPPLTHRAALVAGATRRILRVGDAAGYVEPFTGEGIGWALSAARILVDSLHGPQGLRPPVEATRLYEMAHRREFRGPHARCRLVALHLRRPSIVAAAVAGARALPWVARALAPVVAGGRPVPGDP